MIVPEEEELPRGDNMVALAGQQGQQAGKDWKLDVDRQMKMLLTEQSVEAAAWEPAPVEAAGVAEGNAH
jgi:hypothetical protein